MLARQITHLARLGLSAVARRGRAAAVRVQVRQGGVAIAVFGHWLVVDVVSERALLVDEAFQLDGDVDALAISASGEGQGARDGLRFEFCLVPVRLVVTVVGGGGRLGGGRGRGRGEEGRARKRKRGEGEEGKRRGLT